LQCLKYLHENGCPWDEGATWAAAEKGHLESLKFLHENGCPWNEEATWAAGNGRHIQCLKYLHENGCPWSKSVSIEWKVQVWWAMFRDMVRVRPLALYLQEMAAIRTHSETGYNRQRDMEEFEAVF